MIRWMSLVLPLTVAGCATLSLKAVVGPDGERFYEAVCKGGGLTFSDCLNLAAEQCHGGYEILERDEQTQKTAVHTRVVSVDLSPETKRKGMTFRCKKLDTAVVP